VRPRRDRGRAWGGRPPGRVQVAGERDVAGAREALDEIGDVAIHAPHLL
jgi:hypothetical protein